jgi:homogentisate 1,2-dioxygenase
MAPQKSLRDYFYKNADADEMIFIHKGKGNLYHDEISHLNMVILIIPEGLSIKLILKHQ